MTVDELIMELEQVRDKNSEVIYRYGTCDDFGEWETTERFIDEIVEEEGDVVLL